MRGGTSNRRRAPKISATAPPCESPRGLRAERGARGSAGSAYREVRSVNDCTLEAGAGDNRSGKVGICRRTEEEREKGEAAAAVTRDRVAVIAGCK